ncbi:MAG: SwmB domain-containing protein, partial [Bacteroidales bacterium]
PAGGQAASISAQNVTNNITSANLAYVTSVIANSTPALLSMTYNLPLANIIPDVSSFTVIVNNVARSVTAIAISGSQVQLTLASSVVYGDIVTVAYTKPGTNPIQTPSGAQAESITAQSVTNNVTTVIPLYVSSVIQNASPSLLSMTYNLALANIVPAATAFTVMVNNVARTVASVAISGTNVQLTLASPVINGDVITVAYTKPSRNPLQTSSGGQAATITAQNVTNNVNPNNPSYVSSVIQNATPSLLTVTYNLTLANIVPDVSSFTVLVNNILVTINSITISGTDVLLNLSNPVHFGDVITVAYSKPASNPLQTSSGAQASSIIAQVVTNNVTTVIPVYISSAIENATPSLLTLKYNLTLANIIPSASAFTVRVNNVTRAVTSVTVSGSNVLLTLVNPVINGDIITVAYTKPSTNPLQTSSGGQAASISAQSVTNNVNPVNPVNPSYVSSAIENATPSILTMTYDLTLANIVPSVSAFRVTVNNVVRSVTRITVSGTNVLLTLASPVVYGDVITVAYTKPSRRPLQTSSGGQAASITAQSVTNNVIPVNPGNPAYISSVIENATPSLLTMTYDLSLANIVPDISSFTVSVNNINETITYIAVSGTNVLLTLANPVFYGDVITVAYTKPATNPLQTSSGGQAESLTAQQVTNNVSTLIPVNPNYVGSVIKNATPSVLEMIYDIDLADIVPDTSSFIVQVNSVNLNIDTVVISGTSVLLTLASPVVYGDVVSVSYTKPDINPLQSVSGTQASSISDQPVDNQVSFINSPPVIVINYDANNYSGFIGEINASTSYDINGDSLSFEWTPPANVEVSSLDGSTIQFLAPMVKEADTIKFILNVSDGQSVTTQTVFVNILPYKPELSVSKLKNVTASDNYGDNYPYNIIDDNLETIWSTDDIEPWLILALANPVQVGYFELAFQKGQRRASYFDIYASKDGLSWDPILLNASSSTFASGYQIFDMPDEKASRGYSFIKLVGQGNAEDSWNSYSEFKVFGKQYIEEVKMNVYPNPANDIVNISLKYPTASSTDGSIVVSNVVRIFDSSGRLVLEKPMDPGTSKLQIPINLQSGIYIIQMTSGWLTVAANKLIVIH